MLRKRKHILYIVGGQMISSHQNRCILILYFVSLMVYDSNSECM